MPCRLYWVQSWAIRMCEHKNFKYFYKARGWKASCGTWLKWPSLYLLHDTCKVIVKGEHKLKYDTNNIMTTNNYLYHNIIQSRGSVPWPWNISITLCGSLEETENICLLFVHSCWTWKFAWSYCRGLSIPTQNIDFPLKFATGHAHICHTPLVSHMEITFQHYVHVLLFHDKNIHKTFLFITILFHETVIHSNTNTEYTDIIHNTLTIQTDTIHCSFRC